MLSFSPEKLFIVLIVALIVLGPDKLPRLARQLGAVWKQIVQFQQRMEREVRETIPDLPSSHEIAKFARSPASLLTSLSRLDEKGKSSDSDQPSQNEGDLTAHPVPRSSGDPGIPSIGDPGMN